MDNFQLDNSGDMNVEAGSQEALYEPDPPERFVAVKVSGVKPVVVYVLLGATILVFLLQIASQFFFEGVDLPVLIGVKVNELIMRGEVWRLFTPMFLHGSILHIGFNMYALYIFGPGLEHHYGHWRFLSLYVLSGFAGNVVSFVFSDSMSLGSSTAIFGLLGGQAVFLYQNRSLFGDRARRALANIAMIAVINLVIGLSPGIDNWGHIGGLLGGTLFAWFAGPLLKLEGGYPAITIRDSREPGDILRAGLGIGSAIVFLAILAIFLRR